jgi:catechol 2,3-dioxygenase-like lactoylglutathione lyase family enzyme
MWLQIIDHIQITSPPDVEDAMLFFYGKVLGLKEIYKPDGIKAFGGAWYLLGDIQLHISLENNPNNEKSRRHICFRVQNLPAIREHLQANGVEIIADQNPIPGCDRFFLRDPGGNRIEIAEFTHDKK